MTYDDVHPNLADGLPDDALALLESMYRIRFFENEVMGLFSQNLVRGSTHLCQGQEAITVGVAAELRTGDTVTYTYRGHGAVIAQGAPLDRAFGELLGRAGGLSGGLGGSMHFADVSVGALGGNGIVGAHLPTTVGAALAASYRGTDEVSVAYFGDGSTNIGTFHESLNLASVWKLPAIFVIENNQYGEYSTVAATTPIARLRDRAASYGMPGIFVDGNDVVAVRSVARWAIARARAGEGPTLIEADTYRHSGHSRADPAKYRPEAEVAHWFGRDPILALRAVIERELHDGALLAAAVEERVQREVIEARDRALTWPEPDVDAPGKAVFA